MSPHNDDTSSAPKTYYSAYRGPIFGLKGNFSHFARQCDPLHIQNGYWRFSTREDERRAYELGMSDPEAILIAQDAGDGDYRSIMLHWIPGELDLNNKPSRGSAAAHLETIYNERKLLNKTLSFRGQVPVYSTSTNHRLLQYRLIRYGIQKGALPPTTLLSSSRQLPLPKPVAPNSLPEEIIEISSSLVSRPVPIRQRDGIPSEAETRSVSTPRGLPKSEAPLHASSPYQPIVSTATHILPQQNHNKASSAHSQSSIVYHDRFSIPSPVSSGSMSWGSPDTSKRSRSSSRKGQRKLIRRRESITTDDEEDDTPIIDRDDWLANTLIDSHRAPASTAGGLLHDFEAQIATIPCMDCGSVGSHVPGCWIDKVAMSLKPIEELSLDETRDLADSATRFDPVPYRTHEEPLPDGIRDLADLVTGSDPELRMHEEFEPEVEEQEDLQTQIRGMAEVIRNLDGSAEDPDLYMLDDRATVLLWAFKACGNVEVFRE